MVLDFGLISQVPHRSEANFGESCQGQDVILIISIVIHCVELSVNSVYFSAAFVNSVCELNSVIFFFR